MNHRAIDAGATAFVEVEVPASWADAEDEAPAEAPAGRPELVKMVTEIMEPVGRMAGDSLPVSVFVDHADGQFEHGRCRLREARRVRHRADAWDAEKCTECNSCSFVCPHACIRPFAFDRRRGRLRARGDQGDPREGQGGQGGLGYTLAISPLDCMGCEGLRRPVSHRCADHGGHRVGARSARGVRLLRGEGRG